VTVLVSFILLWCCCRFQKALPIFVSTLVQKVDLLMLLKMRSLSRSILAEYVFDFYPFKEFEFYVYVTSCC